MMDTSLISHIQWNLSNTDTFGPIKCVLIREGSSFQGANDTPVYEVGTWSSVLIREVSLIQGCPLRVPLYIHVHVLLPIAHTMQINAHTRTHARTHTHTHTHNTIEVTIIRYPIMTRANNL